MGGHGSLPRMRHAHPGATPRTELGPAFASCSTCRQTAVEAVTHALLYLAASAAPSLIGPLDDASLELRFTARIRIDDLAGRPLAEDELTVDQRLTLTAESPEEPEEVASAAAEAGGDPPAMHHGPVHAPADPRVLVDSVELRPAGSGELEGAIAGRLLDHEQPVAAFQVGLGPPSAVSRVG